MTAPGSVPPPSDDMAKRLAALERRVDELSRKNIDRSTVGQGGVIRGLYKNGNEAFLFGVDPDDGANKSQIKYSDGQVAFSVAPGAAVYGGKEQLRINDLNGRAIMVTDEVAGYGLSHPGFAYPVWGREELQPGNSAPNAVTVAEGHNQVYNPVWYVTARMRLVHNIVGTSTVNFFLEIRSGSTVIATSGIQAEAVTGSVIVARSFIRMCAIPANYIASGLSARIQAYTATPSDFGVTVYPLESKGTSRAFYDLSPGFT